MEVRLKDYIRDKIEILLDIFDEQMTVLSASGYEYVDLQLIENMWDSHIKQLSQYMGVSAGTYDLIEWFFLDGAIYDDDMNRIEDIDGLVDYIIKKNAE